MDYLILKKLANGEFKPLTFIIFASVKETKQV